MEKIYTVIADGGKPKRVEAITCSFTLDGYFRVELVNHVDIGKCACCGGVSRVFFGGNIVAFFCDKRNRVKMCAHHSDDTCPGITSCLNREDFDVDFFEEKKRVVKEIIDVMFTIYDVVLVEIEMESKEIVAETFLKNQEFIVRTVEVDERSGLEDVYVLKKNKKIMENKAKVATNGEKRNEAKT